MTDSDGTFTNKIPPCAFKRIKADVQPDQPFTLSADLTRLVVPKPEPDPQQEAS